MKIHPTMPSLSPAPERLFSKLVESRAVKRGGGINHTLFKSSSGSYNLKDRARWINTLSSTVYEWKRGVFYKFIPLLGINTFDKIPWVKCRMAHKCKHLSGSWVHCDNGTVFISQSLLRRNLKINVN